VQVWLFPFERPWTWKKNEWTMPIDLIKQLSPVIKETSCLIKTIAFHNFISTVNKILFEITIFKTWGVTVPYWRVRKLKFSKHFKDFFLKKMFKLDLILTLRTGNSFFCYNLWWNIKFKKRQFFLFIQFTLTLHDIFSFSHVWGNCLFNLTI
jgi:hypothetical protein